MPSTTEKESLWGPQGSRLRANKITQTSSIWKEVMCPGISAAFQGNLGHLRQAPGVYQEVSSRESISRSVRQADGFSEGETRGHLIQALSRRHDGPLSLGAARSAKRQLLLLCDAPPAHQCWGQGQTLPLSGPIGFSLLENLTGGPGVRALEAATSPGRAAVGSDGRRVRPQGLSWFLQLLEPLLHLSLGLQELLHPSNKFPFFFFFTSTSKCRFPLPAVEGSLTKNAAGEVGERRRAAAFPPHLPFLRCIPPAPRFLRGKDRRLLTQSSGRERRLPRI